ncbi:MAG TPA: helix-turn-helix domain-containing protein [Woeseiaceae bacterium]
MKKQLILENFPPYRLWILSNIVSGTLASTCDKRFGLSLPEWRVIATLARFPGLSAAEVAERTLMDKVAVSRTVSSGGSHSVEDIPRSRRSPSHRQQTCVNGAVSKTGCHDA